ncbi:MAG TPA: DUF4105 domain-containing protein [Silvibacterium sp.]|nr:DUF4105 domain-containing protein [Silvibacterium sp.]
MHATEKKPSQLRKFFHACGHLLVYAILRVLILWTAAALYFDVRIAWLRIPCMAVYLLALVAALVLFKAFWSRVLGCVACSTIVILWWFTLKPSNNENWQADVSRTAYAEVNGNIVTIHNLRNCDYRAEFDYTCAWETKQVNLDDIRGLDLFLDYWGSPWIAHTILSFDFGNGVHIPFSIEARKQVGQSYSAIRGFFRQFTLISVISTERDVVRLRTNYRKDEDLYLYHTTATIPFTRALFLDYIGLANDLHNHPSWYNALTDNCTTQIFQLEAMRSQPWKLAILLNGKGDEMEYKKGNLAADGLPFDELKVRAYINPAAETADQDPDFSARIRANRPGFAP